MAIPKHVRSCGASGDSSRPLTDLARAAAMANARAVPSYASLQNLKNGTHVLVFRFSSCPFLVIPLLLSLYFFLFALFSVSFLGFQSFFSGRVSCLHM